MHAFPIKPDQMEKINPVGRNPKWIPTHHTQIALNKDQAIMLANMTSGGVTIYTDRSDIDSQVGAAAILFKDTVEQAALHKHLGMNRQHTVFEVELVGAILLLGNR